MNLLLFSPPLPSPLSLQSKNFNSFLCLCVFLLNDLCVFSCGYRLFFQKVTYSIFCFPSSPNNVYRKNTSLLFCSCMSHIREENASFCFLCVHLGGFQYVAVTNNTLANSLINTHFIMLEVVFFTSSDFSLCLLASDSLW